MGRRRGCGPRRDFDASFTDVKSASGPVSQGASVVGSDNFGIWVKDSFERNTGLDGGLADYPNRTGAASNAAAAAFSHDGHQ